MIILEGPDGSGKTTLLKKLMVSLGLPQGPRASSSLGGPVKNLLDWTWQDVGTMTSRELAIYDRHPLISEYIYGPVRADGIRPGMLSRDAAIMRRRFAQRSFIVFCLPPLETVRANLAAEAQMDRVAENIDRIYEGYVTTAMNWPGRHLVYDYTQGGDRYNLLLALNLYRMERAKEC